MKMNCNIAGDLLPLYIDDACSQDSRAALEAHLGECEQCRARLERMRGPDMAAPARTKNRDVSVANCARKIRRRRIRAAVLATALCAVLACVLALVFMTLRDMHAQANPTVFPTAEGVYNLTAGNLETTAAQAGEYVLFTNYKQIQVALTEDAGFDGEILLWDAEYDEVIQYGTIDPGTDTCVFTGLTAAQYYKITFPEGTDFSVTISEGRAVSFWSSLKNVLIEMFD